MPRVPTTRLLLAQGIECDTVAREGARQLQAAIGGGAHIVVTDEGDDGYTIWATPPEGAPLTESALQCLVLGSLCLLVVEGCCLAGQQVQAHGDDEARQHGDDDHGRVDAGADL